MKNFVKIVSVSEERTDKNGRVFKLITVSSDNRREITDPVTGEIFFAVGKPKRTTIVAYQESYLDNTPHYLYDLPVNTVVSGNIVSKAVEPYTIDTKDGPKEAKRYTAFVEAEQEDPQYDEIVERVFENAGHSIVSTASAATPPVQEEDKSDSVSPTEAFDAPENSEEENEEDTKRVPVMAEDDAEDFEDEF